MQTPSKEEGGANIRVESDGEGGINIVAETPPMANRKDSTYNEVETHIRDETTETVKEEVGDHANPLIWLWCFLLALLALAIVIKRIFNNN